MADDPLTSTHTLTFYRYDGPDPGPVRDVRTYPSELIYDGVAYPVTVTERSDGSVRIHSEGLVPKPESHEHQWVSVPELCDATARQMCTVPGCPVERHVEW